MPELPEVETVVRSLRGRLVGAWLRSLWWSRLPLRLGRAPDVAGIRRVSLGARVAGVQRRGKYVILDLAGDERGTHAAEDRSDPEASGRGGRATGRRPAAGAPDRRSLQAAGAPGGNWRTAEAAAAAAWARGRRTGTSVRANGKAAELAEVADPQSLPSTDGGGRGFGPAARSRGAVVVHLGMTGRLQVVPADAPRAPHTHLVWKLEGKDAQLDLRFVDPRRFGWVGAARDLATVPELALLGPDPLTELQPAGFVAALAASRAPIKSFLLDQRRVAGLGNIYVCEALFRARVAPATPAFRARARAAALFDAIQAVLEQGITNRGTTLRDYVDADGAPGDNATTLRVYGREGKPCIVCRAEIVRRVDAARSTFFCPRCQR